MLVLLFDGPSRVKCRLSEKTNGLLLQCSPEQVMANAPRKGDEGGGGKPPLHTFFLHWQVGPDNAWNVWVPKEQEGLDGERVFSEPSCCCTTQTLKATSGPPDKELGNEFPSKTRSLVALS